MNFCLNILQDVYLMDQKHKLKMIMKDTFFIFKVYHMIRKKEKKKQCLESIWGSIKFCSLFF